MPRLLTQTTLLIALGSTAGAAPQPRVVQTQATQDDGDDGVAQPSTPPPQDVPQLPTEIPPIATEQPPIPAQDQPPADESNGQWVYTSQYGWIWMPYADEYIYTPEDTTGGYPYQYVYAPAYGWTWLAAPWVWGLGIQPFYASGGFHHRFFVEHEHGFHGGFHGEHFRGGFHGPVTGAAPHGFAGHAMGGFHGGGFHGGGFHGGGFHGGHGGGGSHGGGHR